MMFYTYVCALVIASILLPLSASSQPNKLLVKTSAGMLEGAATPDGALRVYLGVPFAQPPVGELRWKAPQAMSQWRDVRKATEFGPRPMQPSIFGDMVFRSAKMSEDCLYLNVWTPARTADAQLPVLVYFYGGGFVAGSADEPRYDGENMARKGIVVVTVNYRLGIFGFFAHPELTKEAHYHASGNYGLLDQSAALHWVRNNISAFGGNPKHIYIGGESAGSYSVSMQMASPLSKDLIAGAIGESGAIFGRTISAPDLQTAERAGSAFAKEIGKDGITGKSGKTDTHILRDLRAMPAQEILDAVKANPFRFNIINDGYFMPKTAEEIYGAGKLAHVPLLAGWNNMESAGTGILGQNAPTVDGFTKVVKSLYGEHSADALIAYHAQNDSEVMEAATGLASDRFIGYGTWKWLDIHGRTGEKPVYRYLFSRARPGEPGAYHAVEIEYALGNLDRNTVYKWTDDDHKVSAEMLEYFANFIKSGSPNGPGLPLWPAANAGGDALVMYLNVDSSVGSEHHRDRYLFLDKIQYGAAKSTP
jgi:para-nitrobenzyl esterase